MSAGHRRCRFGSIAVAKTHRTNNNKEIAANVRSDGGVCKIEPGLSHLVYRMDLRGPLPYRLFTNWLTRNPVLKFTPRAQSAAQRMEQTSGPNTLKIRRFEMERQFLPKLRVNPILTLEDLGLDRRAGLDQASRGLAERSEAQIVRWVQFPAGALFFTLVPGDPESGGVYLFDRKDGVFYWLNFDDQKWGGYSLADYEALERAYRLSLLAQRPHRLRRWCEPQKTA
jgi:hypothetical protein